MIIKLLYITVPDRDHATNMARILVEEKLAACVNVIGAIDSCYMWQEKITQDNEVLLIAKTSIESENILIQKVKEIHPYECPCIISLDSINGNPDFFEWVNQINK